MTQAWKAACAVAGSKVVISTGIYKLGLVTLLGPCKGAIEFNLQGTLQAPSNVASFNGKDGWVVFEGFDGKKNKAPKNTTMAKFEIRFTELTQDPAAGVKRYYKDSEKPYSTVGTTGKRNNCLLFDCCK